MSYKRLEQGDFVVSSDAVASPMWSNNIYTLTSFFTSSVQESSNSGLYYLNVYDTTATSSIQFAIAYGNLVGSGGAYFNSNTPGYTPTATIYGQFQNLILGDENTNFTFGSYISNEFWAIILDRNRYKESILPGSLTLTITNGSNAISLTDDSRLVSTVNFNEAGRVYQLISGSVGVKTTVTGTTNTVDGYSFNSGSYGWLLPDIGVILLNPAALGGSTAGGGIGLNSNKTTNSNGNNNRLLEEKLTSFSLNSQETLTSNYIFIRPRTFEFNYSENPSFISGSTGDIIYTSFINNPQTFITTIGLYNDNSELLATAKLSRPLLKDFTKEALIRVKLDF